MKNSIIILFSLFAVLCSSCTVESIYPDRTGLEGTTTVTFTPDFGTGDGGPETKAFAEDPQVRNLYLAVFTEGGKSLVEYVKAEPVTLAGENDAKCAYSATLKLSDKPRVIHFIANAPEELNYGTDVDAVGTLAYSFNTDTWAGEDAYWGYLKLDGGICGESNATGYASLVESLSGVKLVRNFAKIQVASVADNFKITRFWLSNFPDRSSIAPYNRDARRFVTEYAGFEHIADAMGTGYKGFSPVSSGLVSLSGMTEDELDDIAVLQSSTASAYVYECQTPMKNPLCVIVGGYYNDSSEECFYKLEIRDDDGTYLPVLRNFAYRITITEVAKKGADSVEDALSSVPDGSIDTNLDLQDLKDFSNGTSRIYVSETERIVLGDSKFSIYYQYVPNLETGTIANATMQQLIASGQYADEAAVLAAHVPYVTITSEPGLSGAVFNDFTPASSDDGDGYRELTMNPVSVTDVIKTEVLTITGHAWNSEKNAYETLSRTVRYQMRNHLEMTLAFNPEKVVGKTSGESIDLIIGIEDKLPQSVFTLDMRIEPENLTLTPAGDELPVSDTTGVNGKPTYYMTRAITWEEYEAATAVEDSDGVFRKYFTCEMMTNTGTFPTISGTSDQGDRVRVSNHYFETGTALYLAGDGNFLKFQNLAFDKPYLAISRSANFSFKMTGTPEDGTINVKMKNVEPVGGSLVWQSRDIEGFDIYEMPVSSTDVSMEVMPVGESGMIAYIQLTDEEFINSELKDIEISKFKFSELQFRHGDELDYIAVGRKAYVDFSMDYMPSDGMVTIFLKNAVPQDAALVGGTPDENGYTPYAIPVSDLEASLPVTITSDTDQTKAYFKLTDSEFVDSSVCEADIEKLKFTGMKYTDMSGKTATSVIAGKPARIAFSMDDMPSDSKITLTLTNLTPVGTDMTGIDVISDKGDGVYELTVNGKDVILGVTPAIGPETASFALSDSEFDDNSLDAGIEKLKFSSLSYTTDPDKDFLVVEQDAKISFSMDQLPNDGDVKLYIKNATAKNLTAGTPVNGYNVYVVPVDELTETIDITVATGLSISASFYLADEQFDTSSTASKVIKTPFTVSWANVRLRRYDPKASGTPRTVLASKTVNVYTDEGCTTPAEFSSVTTNNTGFVSGGAEAIIYSEAGAETYYFKYVHTDNDDYISGPVTLAALSAASGTLDVDCALKYYTVTIPAGRIRLYKDNGSDVMDKGEDKSYLGTGSRSSGFNHKTNMFSVSNGRNQGAITITDCKKSDKLRYGCYQGSSIQRQSDPVSFADILEKLNNNQNISFYNIDNVDN